MQYFSPRGHPLVFQDETSKKYPILTVENYVKWYEIFAVYPDGTVKSVGFPDDSEDTGLVGSAYCDHVPNPVPCQRMAVRLGCVWDENSLDMIAGRWAREVLSQYHCDEYDPFDYPEDPDVAPDAVRA